MISFILLAAQAQQGGGMMPMLLMMAAIFAIMYFFMILPQQKKQKKIREFQNSLGEGAKVIVGNGIYGTVKKVDVATGTIDVEVAKGTVVKVDKNFVFADASSIQVTQEK